MGYKDFGIALLLKQSNANCSLVTAISTFKGKKIIYYVSTFCIFPNIIFQFIKQLFPQCTCTHTSRNPHPCATMALPQRDWLFGLSEDGTHGARLSFSRGEWEPGSTDGCQAGRGHVAADVVCACGALLVVVVDCSDSFLLLFLGDPSSDCCAGARQQHEEERRPKRARY